MDYSKFKAALADGHEWPCEYCFKFIVKTHQEQELLDQLKGQKISKRYSSSSKYVSISARSHAEVPDDVIAVYKKAASVEGVIPL